MLLYHYYDKIIGPFKNLSDLTIEQANRVLQEISITKPNVQCAKWFDLRTISFTYGDSHPTFSDRINDEKEYRKSSKCEDANGKSEIVFTIDRVKKDN